MQTRKNIRLREYDYSQAGYYFVTICTKDKECTLWDNISHNNTSQTANGVGATIGRPNNEIILSNIGKLVESSLYKISKIYEAVELDKFVIMPNHVHLILIIRYSNGRPMTAPTISQIIQQFKGSITKQAGKSVWQKSYYDHVIRNDSDYIRICEYIETNPLKWADDEYFEQNHDNA